MSLATVLCESCRHRRGLHKGGGACASADPEPGCRCEAFAGAVVEAPAEEARTELGKVVQIVVPTGFAVEVRLIPMEDETK